MGKWYAQQRIPDELLEAMSKDTREYVREVTEAQVRHGLPNAGGEQKIEWVKDPVTCATVCHGWEEMEWEAVDAAE